ncbi:hypothetical protein [Streptococcus sp. Marseille-Q4154]|uniref:hypothetical protein n=1 Tax=Streptococcus sp. Marseille-Q4154 TaxID=2866598 RepID=UPI001CE46D32|nr:hypothetical protein [Streptococcus sp. Marseille-Q4154]
MIQGFLLTSDYNLRNSNIIIKPNDYCWVVDENNNTKFVLLKFDDKAEYGLSIYEITYTDKYYKEEKIENFIEKINKGYLKFVCSDTNDNNFDYSSKREKWKNGKLSKSKLLFIDRKVNNLRDILKILNSAQEILFCKKRATETLSDIDITDAINLAIYEFENK